MNESELVREMDAKDDEERKQMRAAIETMREELATLWSRVQEQGAQNANLTARLVKMERELGE